MNVSFFFHGNPKGHQQWSEDGEIDKYLDSFYYDANETTKLDISVLKNHCYYSYLVYHPVGRKDGGVKECGDQGRLGGGVYFGMTLRTDMFCANIRAMYSIFDLVFQRHVMNNILSLSSNGNVLEYQKASFDECSEKLKKIKGAFMDMVSKNTTKSNWMSISGFPSTDKSMGLHPDDCYYIDVINEMKKYGRLSFSIDNKKKSELRGMTLIKNECEQVVKQYKDNAEQARKDAESRCKEKDAEIQKVKGQLSESISDKEQLSRKYNEMLQDSGKSKEQLRSICKELKGSLQRLDEYVSDSKQLGLGDVVSNGNSHQVNNGTPKDSYHNNNEIDVISSNTKTLIVFLKENKRVVAVLLMSVMIICACIFLLKKCNQPEQSATIKGLPFINVEKWDGKEPLTIGETYTVSVHHPVEGIKLGIDGCSYSETDGKYFITPNKTDVILKYTDGKQVFVERHLIAQKQENTIDATVQSSTNPQPISPSKTPIPKIDIQGYNPKSGGLRMERKYTVNIKNPVKGGTIMCKGCTEQNNKGNSVEITPTDAEVEITYQVPGIQSISRKVPVAK